MNLPLLALIVAAQAAPVWQPEADREIAELNARIDAELAKAPVPEAPRDKDWVKRKLHHMVQVDQMARMALFKHAAWPREASDYFDLKVAARMDVIDRANTVALQELLKSHSWFTVSEFGSEADDNAWLLVQHADHDPAFQQRVLEILTKLPKGETRLSNYAYLWDRVAGHTGKKQRYGTQGHCAGPGRWEPFEMEDPGRVDERRASIGLAPMEVYERQFKELGLCP